MIPSLFRDPSPRCAQRGCVAVQEPALGQPRVSGSRDRVFQEGRSVTGRAAGASGARSAGRIAPGQAQRDGAAHPRPVWDAAGDSPVTAQRHAGGGRALARRAASSRAETRGGDTVPKRKADASGDRAQGLGPLRTRQTGCGRPLSLPEPDAQSLSLALPAPNANAVAPERARGAAPHAGSPVGTGTRDRGWAVPGKVALCPSAPPRLPLSAREGFPSFRGPPGPPWAGRGHAEQLRRRAGPLSSA